MQPLVAPRYLHSRYSRPSSLGDRNSRVVRVARSALDVGTHLAAICNQPTPQQGSPPLSTASTGQLLQWAAAHGGSIHPSLIVTEDAPCGCRGVVASRDIAVVPDASWPQHGSGCACAPLVAVPKELCMTNHDAMHLLSQAMSSSQPGEVTKSSSSPRSQSHGTNWLLEGSANSPAVQSSHSWPGVGSELLQAAMRSLQGLLRLQQPSAAALLQQRLRQLQPPMLLALLLAHQRRLGTKSFWFPYISSLPARPPCAWYDAVGQQLASQANVNTSAAVTNWQLPAGRSTPATAADSASTEPAAAAPGAPLPSEVAPGAVQAAAAAVSAKCSAAANIFGTALGGLTAADIAWAYGQVASRAFGVGGSPVDGGGGLALLPVIDMLNHAAGAAVPVCWQGEGSPNLHRSEAAEDMGGAAAESIPLSQALWCVWPSQLPDTWARPGADAAENTGSTCECSSSSSGGGGVLVGTASVGSGPHVVLKAGDELYISYMSSCDATAAFLSFGFVPPELQHS